MFNRTGFHLVITEEGVRALNNILGNLALETGAKAVLLLDKGGQMIAAQGETNALDTMSLAALITGSFSSTKAIAGLLGEDEFKIMFQQGANNSIFMSAIGTQDILALIFPNEVTVGRVKYKTLQVLDQIDKEMKAMYSSTPPDSPFRKTASVEPKVNDLF